MSSSPGTGPSPEPIRYAHGSTRIGRTSTPCVTLVFPTIRGSAHWRRTTGWLACTHGNSRVSPNDDAVAERDRPGGFWSRSGLLEGQPDPERDEDGAGHRVEDTADHRTA